MTERGHSVRTRYADPQSASFEAVFFDLDDTLCDFQPAWEKAIGHALSTVAKRTGVPYDRILSTWQDCWSEMMQELSSGRLNMQAVREKRLPYTFDKLGIRDAALALEVDFLLGEALLDELTLYDDIDIIDRLRPRYKTAIVTNGADDDHPDSQRSKAIRLSLLERVDAFFASDTHGARKPDSRFFLTAAEALGVQPNSVLFVGDSIENDVAGANRAGMQSVLLWRSGATVPDLQADQKPGWIINSLSDLEALLAAN